MERIYLRDIKEGDVIIEYDMGMSIEMVAMEDAHIIKEEGTNGWSCKCWADKDPITLFEAFDCGAYGLKLYRKV